MFVQISPSVQRMVFDPAAANLTTRNLYYHPNPLFRWIFWERLRVVFRMGEGLKAQSVLDLGCGGGELLASLARSFPRVVGLDLNTVNARKLVDYYDLRNVDLREGDFLGVPLAERSFDLVIGCDVLEHQPNLGPFLVKMLSVLKPEGRIIVCIPTENIFYRWGRKLFRLRTPEDHHQNYPQVLEELKKYFQIEATAGVPFDFFPLFKVLKCIKRQV